MQVDKCITCMQSIKGIGYDDCDSCSTSKNYSGCLGCLKVVPGGLPWDTPNFGSCIDCDKVRQA